MSKSYEPQREREVQRYLQSWQVAQGSSLNVALSVDSIAASDLRVTGYTPKVSSDKALTAFAQLAVLRLNVKRAMVSLIDSAHQTILAEATRNLRLGHRDNATTMATLKMDFNTEEEQVETVEEESDVDGELWLGASVLSRPDAVCEHCLVDTCTARDADGKTYTAPGLIISDCRLDPRFADRTYVLSEPGVRFYAGVPIISRSGHKIGAYAVSDESPREGLTVAELKFMQDVAAAVSEHMEWARDRVDRFKGERIVRGLAAFIEGCSTLSDDSSWTKEEPAINDSGVRPPAMTVSTRKRPAVRVTSVRHDTEAKSATEARPTTPPVSAPPSASASPTSQRSQKPASQHKTDQLTRMYQKAADILRHSTLADGIVFFGAQATNSRHIPRVSSQSGHGLSDEEDHSMQGTSGSEGIGMDSSDSDASPAGRPCKILAYSLASEQARADIEQGTALSLGTLEKYFAMFPRGKTFSFTDEGAGVSSEDDSASDREPAGAADKTRAAGSEHGRRRRGRMDHKELLKKIPGAKTVVFLPLFDHAEDRLAGGCFLWTSIMGRMMNLDDDLSYLRAFSNSIMSQVGRINTQKNEAAKTTFIASMSHELRSPLHGILGAAEFLKDTGTDSYQSALINSIYTCGKTLLDTLNHVLDYSKINRLGRTQLRRGAKQNKQIKLSSDSLESLNMTAVVDLSTLVEEVVDAIAAGHTFQTLPATGIPDVSLSQPANTNEKQVPNVANAQSATGKPVSVFLDICPSASKLVKTQPGALRRIVMNLFGNALKYTTEGHIIVSVRAQQVPGRPKIDALIRVVDTGKGMSEEFQRDRLFVPFSQEDSFQPGTGLGLSIVKQIVDSLGGSLDVKSQQYKGTEVDVRLRLTLDGDEPPKTLGETEIKGLHLRLLDGERPADSAIGAFQTRKFDQILKETCVEWFDMKVSTADDYASQPDVFLYSTPPSQSSLQDLFAQIQKFKRRVPVIILCPNAEEAMRYSQIQNKQSATFSRFAEVLPQPCGPKKLAKMFYHCLHRSNSQSPLANSVPALPETTMTLPLPPVDPIQVQKQDPAVVTPPVSDSASTGERRGSLPSVLSPPPLDPGTPPLTGIIPVPKSEGPFRKNLHVLLVDDNKINLQLLVMFVKKCGFSYAEAENGQEALDRFNAASLDNAGSGGRKGFDFILMDISMPVMNGIEATKRIREVEREHSLPSTNIIALTGLASADAQRDAKTAGVDIFMPKPVRFAELKKLFVTQPVAASP